MRKARNKSPTKGRQMKNGHSFLLRGQRYTFVSEREYWTRNDRRLMLLVFRSHCADCGALFECQSVKSTFRSAGRKLNRRCKAHRKPGVRVPKPPKRQRQPKEWDGTAPRPWLAAPALTADAPETAFLA